MEAQEAGTIRRLGIIGNHLPRQCGIATFTTDLCEAVVAGFPSMKCFVLAVNDPGHRHDYPALVRYEIAQSDPESYHRAARFLDENPVDVVSLQHEYGIFGGTEGSHILTLLEELPMPVVTTLHTVLARPTASQTSVLNEVIRLSERVVVMSARGSELLQEVHGTPARKIDLIPHGTPAVPASKDSKLRLGIQGKSLILTFGLLSPDKGIEYVIDAMPKILARFPDTLYFIVGVTHPHVRKQAGESYRLMLEQRALGLGVDRAVVFHNRFVARNELVEFLSAADIYVTPYLKEEQITSGTLAYAVGFGKPSISTPYLYAREILADDRGILVPWRDPAAIAAAVTDLLGDDAKRLALGERAASRGEGMVWPAVARRYLESFGRALSDSKRRNCRSRRSRTLAQRSAELPELNLGHVRSMTDHTGIFQHAVFTVPRYGDGYCLDDNARALLLATLVEDAGDGAGTGALANRYLAFMHHAWNVRAGRFRNFMSYSREWTEETGSEDSHGRAIWALGTLLGPSADGGRRRLASELFHASLAQTLDFSSPRAWAYTLLGVNEYLSAVDGDRRVQVVRGALATRLLRLYEAASVPGWPWFEPQVSYCNARLPQALLASGAAMEDVAMMRTGLLSLRWLVGLQLSDDGYFAPIGSNGFYPRGGAKASFDQQPVEACGMVSACLEAGRLTGEPCWDVSARRALDWYLGQNELHESLVDPGTGGCRDGLHADRVNANQGAESTLSYCLALAELRAVGLSTRPGDGREMNRELTE